MKQSFNPDDRTYLVSDERLKAFKSLTPAERLKWVEELAIFLRLAKLKSTSSSQLTKNLVSKVSQPKA